MGSGEFRERAVGLQEFLEKLPPAEVRPPYRVLAELSGASASDARKLAQIWTGWRPAYLRNFLRRLAALAEENILYEFEAIFTAGLTAADPVARATSIAALGESSNKLLAQRFTRILKEDSSREVREAAALGLARFAIMACEGKMIERDYERIREALEFAIRRPEEALSVRRRAIEAIGSYPNEINERIIVDAYQSGDRLLQQSALFAMGRSGNRRWLPEITRSVESNNAGVRYEAVGALGLVGEEDDAPLLVAALEDDDLQVRAAAVLALGRIGGPAAVRIVKRELGSKIPVIAEAAREALEELELGDPMLPEAPGLPGHLPDHDSNGHGGSP